MSMQHCRWYLLCRLKWAGMIQAVLLSESCQTIPNGQLLPFIAGHGACPRMHIVLSMQGKNTP